VTGTDSPPLKRTLSLLLLSFYGIGTIVGAGIYVLVGQVAGVAGMAVPWAFLVAALLVLFSAFSYAELSARFPRSAGEAIYVSEGFGWPPLAIAVGLLIIAIGVVSCATLLHGFVGYLQVFLPLPAPWVIVSLATLMGVIVGWGIRQSALIASLMTVIELGGLLLVLWVTRDAWSSLPSHGAELLPAMDPLALAGVLVGAFVAFYAFIGFEDIVNVAEEVRQPTRNLPRAILIAWSVTTLLYLLVSMAVVLTLPPAQLAGSEAPLALIYQHQTGRAPVLLTAISLMSVLNGALIQVIMASRVLYGMSRQGWLPAVLGRVHPYTRTPLIATAMISVAILLMALWLPLLSLAKLTSLITLMVFTLVNLSLWRVKRRQPTVNTFRVPLWVPIVGFCINLGFIGYQLLHWQWA
jgi:APA family basic amino acid/polyamine antiporter